MFSGTNLVAFEGEAMGEVSLNFCLSGAGRALLIAGCDSSRPGGSPATARSADPGLPIAILDSRLFRLIYPTSPPAQGKLVLRKPPVPDSNRIAYRLSESTEIFVADLGTNPVASARTEVSWDAL